MKTHEFKVSVVIVREGETWVAQCLEYDIAAQGSSISAAKEAFAKTFCGQVIVDLHHGQEPLGQFAGAPSVG